MDRSSYRERILLAGGSQATAVNSPGSFPVGAVRVKGGAYVFDSVGTFTGAALEVTRSDGLTWSPLATHGSGGGTSEVRLGADSWVRVTFTGAVVGAHASLAQVS